MMEHLPALQVILPLAAAPLAAICKNGRLSWFIAMLTALLSLGSASLLLGMVTESGSLSYAMGNWAPPVGIEYRVDRLNSIVLLIIAAISVAVMLFARLSIAAEIEPGQQPLFYAAWLLCLSGLSGICITGDAFNLFVFLEISALSSYAMIAMGRDRRALTAALQYLLMGTIGATFLLIGIGLLYMQTGTLNMQDLSVRLKPVLDTRTTQVAFTFIVTGILLKLALFPLHVWLPNAYTQAPSAISAFLAASSTKVALYVLIRFLFSVFGKEYAFNTMQFDLALLILGSTAIIIGSITAVFQHNIKTMLAWSSIAQIGYMAIGLGLVSVMGLSASILHVFNHALMKSALFLALACVIYRIGSCRLEDMKGIAREMPWTMAAFVIAALSLVGVPGTAGFISKWYLLNATVAQSHWLLTIAIIATSLLALLYTWKVIEAAYFMKGNREDAAREAPLALLLPLWVLVIANIWFGIDTGLSAGNASAAANWLMEARP